MLPGMGPRRALVACTLLAVAAAGLSAGATAQTVTLNQGGKDVRIAIGGEAALPADFPGDVALPQPHTVVRVQHSGAVTTVELDVPGATVDDAAARFRADMLAAGWTAAAVRRPAEGRGQAWEKTGRAVVAWLAPAPAGIRMQLELLPQRGTAATPSP
jgi:hypothetical protein